MSASIADLIADFSSPAPSEGIGLGILRRARQADEPDTAPAPAQNAMDRQAELLQAVEVRVRAEEKEKARERLEQALKVEQDRHREDLAVQREIWVEQEAQQLSAQIVTALGNLEATLSERAARILSPVIPEALRQKAIIEFKEALRVILSGEAGALVRVTGPKDILMSIKADMALCGAVEFVPSDAVEVKLVAGDTIIQTQFGAWSDRLQSVLKA